MQITKFRVNNLCCAGEEKLIHSALEDMLGIDQISVNILSRFAIIKHCGVQCCAPPDKILSVLNGLHLGVSIQDINDNELEKGKGAVWTWQDAQRYGYVALVDLLFLAGLIVYLIPSTHRIGPWILLSSLILGILPVLRSCVIAVFSRHTIDINILILVACIGSLVTQDYFDAALVIALFLSSELLEQGLMTRIQRLIEEHLHQTIPKKAFLTTGEAVPIEALQVGQHIAVRAGELIPCDGTIVKGDAVIDESSLTGESIPVQKDAGKDVLSGTVVQNGYLEVEITKPPSQNTIRQLQTMIEEIQSHAGQYAKIVDFFSLYWTPLIILACVSVILIGGGVSGDWLGFTMRGLVILVLACPCAIVISAPIPTSCAMALAAKSGLVLRNAAVLDKLTAVDTLCLDKTGTLTKGFFSITHRSFLAHPFFAPEQIMEGVVAMEQKSTHPLANAIVSDYFGCVADLATTTSSSLPMVKRLRVLEGIGMEARVYFQSHGDEYSVMKIGNERVLISPSSPSIVTHISDFRAQAKGDIVLYITVDDTLVGMLALADVLRPEAPQFLLQSREKHGLDVFMLTGDNATVAAAVCNTLNVPVDHCFAQLFPQEKLAKIRALQSPSSPVQQADTSDVEQGMVHVVRGAPLSNNKKVLMIGDGINDAASLAAATVGCAMGASGTAMASVAADMILLQDNLLLIPEVITLSKTTHSIIIQNIVFAVAVKLMGIVLAVLGE